VLALDSPKTDLAVGDRAPNFVLPDEAGRFVMFYERTQGRPVLLLLAPRAMDPRSAVVMGAFRARAAAFECLGIDVYLISGAPLEAAPSAAEVLAGDGRSLWWDSAGKIMAAYLTGLGYPAGAEQGFEDRVIALVLDANQRILAVLDGVDESLPERACHIYRDLPAAGPSILRRATAPVLIMPNLIDDVWCDGLVGLWLELEGHNTDPAAPTLMPPALGVGREGTLREHRQHVIADPATIQRLQGVLGRRLAPELQRAFSFEAFRFDEIKVARYTPGSGATVNPWAAAAGSEPMERCFALTLELNARHDGKDGKGYGGGEMVFPEYGRARYRPDKGGAVIHSANLMLELRPVTRGQRYTLACVLVGQ